MRDEPAATVAVRQERRGDVLMLVMAERPVNALGAKLRAALSDSLATAASNPAINAVVICSDIAHFSAGLDLGEETDAEGPSLADLCVRVENLSKPVVVAINGSALGCGLELALAAHGRIASESARLGCPEVSLGLVPKAGATQRLPRLVGAESALNLLLESTTVAAPQALSMGLIDKVAVGDLREAACTLAESLLGRPPRKTCDRRDGFRDARSYQMAVTAARKRTILPHLPAAGRAVDCVEAAQLLPFAQGLTFEAMAHDELARTEAAMGLRHAMAAEQLATRPPRELTVRLAPELTGIAIWGGGDLSADLAAQALAQGLRVVLVEPGRDALIQTVEKIAARQDAALAQGRITEGTRDADWARLRSTMTVSVLSEADLILTTVDAGPIPMETDVPVLPLGALPGRAGEGKLALHVAAAAGLPAELAFTHGSNLEAMALGLALARRLGWRMLFTGPGGPIERRLRAALSAAIAWLETDGVARDTIAASLASYGIGMGSRAALPAAPPDAKLVLDACLGALANQGARLLGEGVARRAGDIDAAAVLAGVFPRWQGGPMFWADQRGLIVLRADLRHRAVTAPQVYAPDPLFDRLIADGHKFATVDSVPG